MKLWQGTFYKDDRLFILDLQQARKGQQMTWAVTTRRNVDGFPPFRVDDFSTREQAINFICRIEPTTPRISLEGRSPDNRLSYAEYIEQLRREGIPSAMEIYELNSTNRGELIIEEVSQDELRDASGEQFSWLV